MKDSKVNWDIIDKHTTELTRYANMTQIKAMKDVAKVLKDLWDKDWFDEKRIEEFVT